MSSSPLSSGEPLDSAEKRVEFAGITGKRAIIQEYISLIDWRLVHHGCEHWYFYNHKNKCTNMYLLFAETDGRICLDGKDYRTPSFNFYLKDLTMEFFAENCVSFAGTLNKSIFILCQNFDKARQQRVTRSTAKPKRKVKENGESPLINPIL